MTGQPTLFDAPVHRDATDTELEAAARIAPVAGDLRRRVRGLALERGVDGVTGWETVVGLGLERHETSVRPRLTELAKDGAFRKSRIRRPNAHGNREVVYIAVEYWSEELHNPARGDGRDQPQPIGGPAKG
ncbi:MAG: hypothetical protein OEW52_00215 [Thermoleophilia bacterium]|nr:hypothetical protein [Thermoleophilia bacterium]